MKKVICECGSSKWRWKERLTYTCIPPIHADIYECAKCGKTYEKTDQQTIEEYYPEIEIFDDEPLPFAENECGEDINGDLCFDSLSYPTSGTSTTLDDTTSYIAEPSKVTFE